jgi:hypothetical protein
MGAECDAAQESYALVSMPVVTVFAGDPLVARPPSSLLDHPSSLAQAWELDSNSYPHRTVT